MADYNNYQMLSLLIRGCFHDAVLLSRAAKRIQPDNLMAYGATYVQASVYGLVRQFYMDYNQLPSTDIVHAQFNALLDGFPRQFGAQQASTLSQELVSVGNYVLQPMQQGEVNHQLFNDMVNTIFQRTVGNALVSQAANEATMSGDYGQLIKQVTDVNAMSVTARQPANILSKKSARPSTVISTGIDWMDMMLGGGLRALNSYSIFAPTGGGKTTLAGQLATGMGLQGHKVGLIFTEQSVDEPELIDRFWALVTGKKIDMFAPYNDESLFPPELVSEDDWKIAKVITSNVHTYDFSKNPGDMDEVRAIASGAATNVKPDVLILDWAGQFAKQLMLTGSVFAKDETQALKHIADECANISRAFGIPVVVFHMLRADCMNPMASYTHADANMCKQFAYNQSYAMVIHPRDDNDIAVIRTTKGRWLGRSEQMVHLRGAFARFDGAQGYRAGRGKWERDSDQRMPSADRRKPAQQQDLASWMNG